MVPRQCIETGKQLIGLAYELSQRGAAVKCSERPARACNGTYLRAGCDLIPNAIKLPFSLTSTDVSYT